MHFAFPLGWKNTWGTNHHVIYFRADSFSHRSRPIVLFHWFGYFSPVKDHLGHQSRIIYLLG